MALEGWQCDKTTCSTLLSSRIVAQPGCELWTSPPTVSVLTTMPLSLRLSGGRLYQTQAKQIASHCQLLVSSGFTVALYICTEHLQTVIVFISTGTGGFVFHCHLNVSIDVVSWSCYICYLHVCKDEVFEFKTSSLQISKLELIIAD